MYPFLDKSFMVEISWAKSPGGIAESYSYKLDMESYRGITRLGGGEPLTEIASRMKKLQEDFGHIASGFSHLKVDTFTSKDREEREYELEAMYRQNDEKKP
jgi:hypothetical protein